MALSLSPVASAALNAATPPTSRRQIAYEFTDYIANRKGSMEDSGSSPFLANVANHPDCENVSPTKLSPALIDKDASYPARMPNSRATVSSTLRSSTSSTIQGSPKKLSSPGKRFPVRVTPESSHSPEEFAPFSNRIINSTQEVPMFSDAAKSEERKVDIRLGNEVSDDTTVLIGGDAEPEEFADETAFSAFSAVPDMTMFAKIGRSPTKNDTAGQAPRGVMERNYPGHGSGIQACRREKENDITYSDTGHTTNLILDFTEQFNHLCGNGHGHPSPTRRGRVSPSKSQAPPDPLAYTINARTPSPKKRRHAAASPSSRMSNLLDFDIPPAPTPRSMPTITPHELEGLKSAFLSEISSLKASLSGKEAEILSLKTAVGDAEKRVGESLEQVREERNLKEQLAVEKEAWEKRGREMEAVLRNVRQEIVHGEHEREALEGKLDESEKRREAAEMMAQEAESKMAGMRAVPSENGNHGVEVKNQTGSTSRDVEVAVEKVARELHTLYKTKHETKVAALKKSYETRWDKKVKDLESRLDDMVKENEELKIGRDATMSGIIPKTHALEVNEELRLKLASDAKHCKELQARTDGLSEELKTVNRDNAQLRHELEKERVEKGELVAACDELLSLQEIGPGVTAAVTSGVENLRGSISRASGLRQPNLGHTAGNSNAIPPGESRIGKVDRNRTGTVQGVRPGSGLGMRSIASSLEKMGSYKGRTE